MENDVYENPSKKEEDYFKPVTQEELDALLKDCGMDVKGRKNR
jgi:hypothetical protein